jgi:hypothetical protein
LKTEKKKTGKEIVENLRKLRQKSLKIQAVLPFSLNSFSTTLNTKVQGFTHMHFLLHFHFLFFSPSRNPHIHSRRSLAFKTPTLPPQKPSFTPLDTTNAFNENHQRDESDHRECFSLARIPRARVIFQPFESSRRRSKIQITSNELERGFQ